MALLNRIEAYYKFEQPSGSLVVDEVAGQNLTQHNDPSGVVGVVGSGVTGDSARTAYLSHAANATFRPGDIDWTIAGWIKMTTKASAQFFWSQYEPDGDERAISLLYSVSADRISFRVYGDGTAGSEGRVDADSLGSPAVDTWYFVVCWHDAFNNEIYIQVNGGAVDKAEHTGGVFASSPQDFEVSARTENNGVSDVFNDELGVWHRLLSPVERSDLYNSGAGLTHPFTGETDPLSGSTDLLNGIEAFWELDEQGGVRADKVGSVDMDDRGGDPTTVPTLVGSGIDIIHTQSRHLTAGRPSNLRFTNQDFTMYALVQVDDANNGGGIVTRSAGASGLDNYVLRYSSTTKRFLFATNESSGVLGTRRTVVSNITEDVTAGGIWYHIFAWFDSTEESINLEVNMSGVNTAIHASGISGADPDLYIGRYVNDAGASFFFNGKIDQVGFWSRKLTGNERNTLYNNGAGLAFSQFGGAAANKLFLFTS